MNGLILWMKEVRYVTLLVLFIGRLTVQTPAADGILLNCICNMLANLFRVMFHI